MVRTGPGPQSAVKYHSCFSVAIITCNLFPLPLNTCFFPWLRQNGQISKGFAALWLFWWNNQDRKLNLLEIRWTSVLESEKSEPGFILFC